MATDPTEADVQRLVKAVVSKFLVGWDSSGKTSVFSDPEDETAFHDLLAGSTRRNAKNLWNTGKGNWDEDKVKNVMEAADEHGKSCAKFAKKYHKTSLTLARVLIELREIKGLCVGRTAVAGSNPQPEILGFVCEI